MGPDSLRGVGFSRAMTFLAPLFKLPSLFAFPFLYWNLNNSDVLHRSWFFSFSTFSTTLGSGFINKAFLTLLRVLFGVFTDAILRVDVRACFFTAREAMSAQKLSISFKDRRNETKYSYKYSRTSYIHGPHTPLIGFGMS